MKTKRLKYNCVACRKARTKCDRSAPVCRRCKRLGLACVSVAVKVGRPTAESQEQTDQLYQDAKNLVEESKKDTGPAKMIKNSILQEVNLKGTNVKTGGAVHNAVQAWCKHWLWIATRRKSVFLMSEALSLAATFKIPFDCISEIMQKTNNKSLLKFEPWVRFSELSNVSLRSLIPDKTIKECYDTTSITRVTSYGRSLFLVSPKMEEYINEKEANEMWCNNSGDVFAKIMTAPSLRSLLKSLGKMLFKNDTIPHVFDKSIGETRTYTLKKILKEHAFINRHGTIVTKRACATFLLSLDGEYYQTSITILGNSSVADDEISNVGKRKRSLLLEEWQKDNDSWKHKLAKHESNEERVDNDFDIGIIESFPSNVVAEKTTSLFPEFDGDTFDFDAPLPEFQ